VIGGSGQHADMAGMSATIAAMICGRCGLDADAVLDGIRAELTDVLLDRVPPAQSVAGGR